MAPDPDYQRTIDLAELARIRRGETVNVGAVPDVAQEEYQRTIKLLPVEERRRRERRAAPPAGKAAGAERRDPARARRRPDRLISSERLQAIQGQHVPENLELRERFLLAEAVGGYEALHDLLNIYSPGLTLSQTYIAKVKDAALNEREVRALREYQDQIRRGMACAGEFLSSHSLENFSRDEIHELHDLLTVAARRDQELTIILGLHLIHGIERAVQRLTAFSQKIGEVQQTVTGIFLVDSEVMFIPSEELMECVNVIFEGVGNPYVAERIDGVLLLAARNLLIRVVSFFSYYGKHQIYNLFHKGGGTANISAITFRIRNEIRKLFEACRQDNKLVLTRVMANAEREFDLSVETIQKEAEETALEAVKLIIPAEKTEPVPVRKSWLKRLVGWFR